MYTVTMNKGKQIAVLGLIALIAFFGLSVYYSTRAMLPSPGGYVTRLQWLEGWTSRGYYGFNCSGYLTNAAGQPFEQSYDIYEGKGNLDFVTEFSGRYTLDESMLQPGDVAAFQGPVGHVLGQSYGVHVAAYLGHGIWIDSDSRRGHVARYKLHDVPAQDWWFDGKVRIYRWRVK